MKPPARKRNKTSRVRDLPVEEYSRWTLAERQRLLKGLETYSSHQISELSKTVSTKTEAEVIFYLKKLKRGLKNDIAAAENIIHRKYIKNLEIWIRFIHQLVDDEEETYSTMIGKLLGLYGEYCLKRADSSGVNFRTIYDYLAGLLLGVKLPVLPPLEAAVVMDLLKNLATFLSQSDITAHKKFVLSNYMMHLNPNPPDKETILRRLLTEIPTPFMPRPLKRNKSHPSMFQRKYQDKLLCDNTLVTVVHFEKKMPSEKTKSSSESQESELSKNLLTKKKLPSNSSSSITRTCAPSETKTTNIVNKEIQKHVQEDPEVIPSTSKMVRPGTSSMLIGEKKSITNSHSNSAVQQQPRIFSMLQDVSLVPAQQDPKIVSIAQDQKAIQPIKKASATCITDNQADKEQSITDPKENDDPQSIPSREIIQNSKDCTNAQKTSVLSSHLKDLKESTVQKEAQIANVFAKNQTSKCSRHKQKRKLFSAEFEMASIQNRKRKLLTDESVDFESSDSDKEASSYGYKPSISWLNPMNIPSYLVNLTKTRKRIAK